MMRLICLFFCLLSAAPCLALTRDRTVTVEIPKQTEDVYVTFKITIYGINLNGSTYQIASHNVTVNVNDYNEESVSHTFYDIYIPWYGNWFATLSDDVGYAQNIYEETQGLIVTHPFEQSGPATDVDPRIPMKLDNWHFEEDSWQ